MLPQAAKSAYLHIQHSRSHLITCFIDANYGPVFTAAHAYPHRDLLLDPGAANFCVCFTLLPQLPQDLASACDLTVLNMPVRAFMACFMISNSIRGSTQASPNTDLLLFHPSLLPFALLPQEVDPACDLTALNTPVRAFMCCMSFK